MTAFTGLGSMCYVQVSCLELCFRLACLRSLEALEGSERVSSLGAACARRQPPQVGRGRLHCASAAVRSMRSTHTCCLEGCIVLLCCSWGGEHPSRTCMAWAWSGFTCTCVAVRLGSALEQPGTLACWRGERALNYQAHGMLAPNNACTTAFSV